MIEIVNSGWQSLIVDGGRYGSAAVGVPPSSALDRYACRALHLLTGHEKDTPTLEVVGTPFSIKIHRDITCAITGAKVRATLDDMPVRPWTSFRAEANSLLQVQTVTEGFRYYIGFSGTIVTESVMGGSSTNLECRFGGYRGRALMAGDRLELREIKDVGRGAIPENEIPVMHPPHILRIVEGPEISFFTDESLKKFIDKATRSVYDVSTNTNRTGIRLEGDPLIFREEIERSIISEGILPGTVQIPGNGLPIIMLYERTIGGYARIALVVKADHDRLAHLKPHDYVLFELVSLKEAETLWETKWKSATSLNHKIRRLS